jgi:hypothetical protein
VRVRVRVDGYICMIYTCAFVCIFWAVQIPVHKPFQTVPGVCILPFPNKFLQRGTTFLQLEGGLCCMPIK